MALGRFVKDAQRVSCWIWSGSFGCKIRDRSYCPYDTHGKAPNPLCTRSIESHGINLYHGQSAGSRQNLRGRLELPSFMPVPISTVPHPNKSETSEMQNQSKRKTGSVGLYGGRSAQKINYITHARTHKSRRSRASWVTHASVMRRTGTLTCPGSSFLLSLG